jgi:hypothetical protein
MTNSPQSWHNVPPVHGTALYPEPVRIEHAVTENDETGIRPPTIDDNTWHVVSSGSGRTLWRSIHLEP